MQVSGEIRFFAEGSIPQPILDWFESGPFAVGGGSSRRDGYLRDPAQRELGIKTRGGQGTEVKGLVTVFRGPLEFANRSARVELWMKWSATALTLDPKVLTWTEKKRWLRKFDTGGTTVREIELGAGANREEPKDGNRPAVGCNVELTEVKVADSAWWTFGGESFAFGLETGVVESVEQSLRRVMGLLDSSAALDLSPALELSYPAWLAHIG